VLRGQFGDVSMKVADHCWVRLGMALVLIALISVGMYSLAGRAGAAGPFTGSGFVLRP
jgi:hypothetical protein